MRISSLLYKATRSLGKAASRANDIETLMTGDPKKIAKRAARKAANKSVYGIAGKITKRLFK